MLVTCGHRILLGSRSSFLSDSIVPSTPKVRLAIWHLMIFDGIWWCLMMFDDRLSDLRHRCFQSPWCVVVEASPFAVLRDGRQRLCGAKIGRDAGGAWCRTGCVLWHSAPATNSMAGDEAGRKKLSIARIAIHYLVHLSNKNACCPKIAKGSLVRKLPSHGRLSWPAFSPSCQPHHHVIMSSTSSGRERVNSGLKPFPLFFREKWLPWSPK